jgi:hypothetical protein
VPRDGVVVSKDCKFLPRKDCLPETMKNWRHGQLLPHKDKQFMIEADSEWKGPEGAKRTPPGNERLTLSGEQEAKDIFEGEDKADLKRQLGALQGQLGVQALAALHHAAVVLLQAGDLGLHLTHGHLVVVQHARQLQGLGRHKGIHLARGLADLALYLSSYLLSGLHCG